MKPVEPVIRIFMRGARERALPMPANDVPCGPPYPTRRINNACAEKLVASGAGERQRGERAVRDRRVRAQPAREPGAPRRDQCREPLVVWTRRVRRGSSVAAPYAAWNHRPPCVVALLGRALSVAAAQRRRSSCRRRRSAGSAGASDRSGSLGERGRRHGDRGMDRSPPRPAATLAGIRTPAFKERRVPRVSRLRLRPGACSAERPGGSS